MINSQIKVKELSLSPENGIGPTEKRFSKVNGKVCQLKMKIFSTDGSVNEVKYNSVSDLSPVTSIVLDEKSFNSSNDIKTEFIQSNEPKSKEYSIASLKERLREAKFSPRQKFRRLVIDNKKFYGMVKSKLSEDDFKLLKGLLASDVMNILNVVTPEIMKGKQINTLLGLSALGKSLREAGQKLQMPMRLGLMDEKRTGAVTKKRYQDLAKVYNEFIKSVFDFCYGNDQDTTALEIAEMTESANSEDRVLTNPKL